MGLHVFPIPIPAPTSLSTRSKHTFTLEPYDLNSLTKISNNSMLGLMVFFLVLLLLLPFFVLVVISHLQSESIILNI